MSAPQINDYIINGGQVNVYANNSIYGDDAAVYDAHNDFHISVNKGQIALQTSNLHYHAENTKFLYLVIPPVLSFLGADGKVVSYSKDQMKWMTYTQLSALMLESKNRRDFDK